jgi:hypothetical protein
MDNSVTNNQLNDKCDDKTQPNLRRSHTSYAAPRHHTQRNNSDPQQDIAALTTAVHIHHRPSSHPNGDV